jgi:hypothetical protein
VSARIRVRSCNPTSPAGAAPSGPSSPRACLLRDFVFGEPTTSLSTDARPAAHSSTASPTLRRRLLRRTGSRGFLPRRVDSC